MPEPRTVCRTPTPGRQPTSIEGWKFDAVRAAILDVVPADGDGIAFADLARAVSRRLPRSAREHLGAVGWYVTTVKLELEVRGELRRGGRPQRLWRCP